MVAGLSVTPCQLFVHNVKEKNWPGNEARLSIAICAASAFWFGMSDTVKFNVVILCMLILPQNTFRTPVYTTSERRNAMGVGLVFEADLATTEHISHWVLQGVCLLLNTD